MNETKIDETSGSVSIEVSDFSDSQRGLLSEEALAEYWREKGVVTVSIPLTADEARWILRGERNGEG